MLVFLVETVPLPMPPPEAADRLHHYVGTQSDIEFAARQAVQDGWTHVSSEQPWPGDVVVQHAHPYERATTAVHPLRWVVADGDGSSSVLLDANLQVAPVSDGSSELSLLGSFRPSTLGLDGEALTGEWSEASSVVARSFLTRVADSLLARGTPRRAHGDQEAAREQGRPAATFGV